MIRRLKRNTLLLLISLWIIACGQAALVGLLAFDPAFAWALVYAKNVIIAASLFLLPAMLFVCLRRYTVKVPPHQRVLTREQVDSEGFTALTMPYVYPHGGIHVYPSALRIPRFCCNCNAESTRIRLKHLRQIAVPVPFCTRCHRRLIALRWTSSISVFLIAAVGLAALILSKGPRQEPVAAAMAGAFAGIVAWVLAWVVVIRHLGFPFRFRRHDFKRDSAILYCRNRDFAESLLAQLLQCHQPIQQTQVAIAGAQISATIAPVPRS